MRNDTIVGYVVDECDEESDDIRHRSSIQVDRGHTTMIL